MDILPIKQTGPNVQTGQPNLPGTTKPAAAETVEPKKIMPTADTSNAFAKEDEIKDKKQLEELTEQMNNAMQSLNTNLQFAVHEKTQQLMVRVIDTKTQQVLKEFPSSEFLDTIAKIQDYVGALLDEKA